MRIFATIAALGVISLAPTAGILGASGAVGVSTAPLGQLTVVQGVPEASVDVSIDDRLVQKNAAAGAVLGPFDLAPGEHRVAFAGDDGLELSTTVMVKATALQDVVLHLPSSVDGDPVVHSYRTPTDPIGPGKSRVLVAHTATVAPADISVDGTVVFSNVANGEFATADVPAGSHVVEILPTGQTTDPILGPLTVDLSARTVTMVYAIGSPDEGSMTLVAHSAGLNADGSIAPEAIDTGSAGLAALIRVRTFESSLLAPGS